MGARNDCNGLADSAVTIRKNDVFLTLAATDEDGKTQRINHMVHDQHGPFTVGDEVELVYFRGAIDRARLAFERSFIWPVVLFIMIGFAVLWTIVTDRRMEAGSRR